jgi:hypothetical protein
VSSFSVSSAAGSWASRSSGTQAADAPLLTASLSSMQFGLGGVGGGVVGSGGLSSLLARVAPLGAASASKPHVREALTESLSRLTVGQQVLGSARIWLPCKTIH